MKRIRDSFFRAFHRLMERLRGAKTMYRRTKSLLILVFVALAIFLTGQLWFVNLSNRNFFLYLSARLQPSVAEGHWEFVRPMRSIYGDGTGRFSKSYSGLSGTGSHDYFDMVLTELFDSGIFVGSGPADYHRLLSQPILKYQYAFSMPGHIFPLGFNQRTGAFLTNRGITEFTSVAIWLPHENENISIFFINENRMWEFAVDAAGLEGFPVHPVSIGSLYFVSAALEEYDDLPPGTFIPRIGDLGRFSYFPIVVANPYIRQGGASLDFIRNQVEAFFDNPASINQRVAGDGVWTYSNIHTVVRYYDTDVLEYASFRPRHRNITSTLIGDFSVALAFIEDDDLVINNFFLKGYEPRGNGYVFWFGYIVDNFPILMQEGWPVSSPDDLLPAPIEVVVEQGRVVRYRRLVHNFHVGETHIRLFPQDLDLSERLYTGGKPILGLGLGYPMRRSDTLRLELYVFYSEDY